MGRRDHDGVSEQAKAGRNRWDDAIVLRANARYRGAMYLAGYSVECLLKTKLMRIHDCRSLAALETELRSKKLLDDDSTIYTHHLEHLLMLAKGRDRLRANPALWPSFNIVNRWSPSWRYNSDLSDDEESKDYFEAVESIRRWIEHNT